MTEDDERAKKRMQTLISAYNHAMPANNFDMPFTKAVTVVSAKVDDTTTPTSTAKATFSFTIPAAYINNPGSGREIHGGAVATFLDNTTSVALVASQRYWGPGVTRNISVTYFRPPRAGDKIVVEAEVVQIGKRHATIQGVMKRQSDGVVLAMCLHEKVNPAGSGSRVFSLL